MASSRPSPSFRSSAPPPLVSGLAGLKATLLEPENIIEKPWGREEWLSVTKRYALKKLVLNKGARFSLQYHEAKEESQHLLSGRIRLLLGRKDRPEELEAAEFLPGETLHIPPGTIHRAEAVEDSVIIEASTTELLDVVRLKDDYAREGTNDP